MSLPPEPHDWLPLLYRWQKMLREAPRMALQDAATGAEEGSPPLPRWETIAQTVAAEMAAVHDLKLGNLHTPPRTPASTARLAYGLRLLREPAMRDRHAAEDGQAPRALDEAFAYLREHLAPLEVQHRLKVQDASSESDVAPPVGVGWWLHYAMSVSVEGTPRLITVWQRRVPVEQAP